MKFKLLFAICLFTLPVLAGKQARLTVNWTFTNVIDGYDHNNKIIVYIDDKMMGESNEFKESSKASFSLDVPAGKHKVRIEDYAFYEGKWEMHRTMNGYSVDAFYERDLQLSANNTIDMKFDIDSETSEFKLTGAKEIMPKGGSTLAVSWIYKNVEPGYDHQNKMEVYVDGTLVGTSATFKESKMGKMTVPVPAGNHEISIYNYAYYNGSWELHSMDNDYSIDAFYITTMNIAKKKHSVNLVFDIETLDTKTTVK